MVLYEETCIYNILRGNNVCLENPAAVPRMPSLSGNSKEYLMNVFESLHENNVLVYGIVCTAVVYDNYNIYIIYNIYIYCVA